MPDTPENQLAERFRYFRSRHPGWTSVLHELAESLGHVDPTVEVETVRQKYGELRVYLRSSTPATDALLREAAEKSRTTCEQCGRPGALHMSQTRWYRTFCAECAEEQGYRPAGGAR
ncbi:hypothetical protein D2E95_09350 [Mycobacteroides abscessus]|nr:hypothetical protein D2E95_09350 [Mycobacteroides abscessus]RIU52503.1 hypothetical protein D2F02_05675 [Mycobacteroides abscessus]